MSWSSCAAVSGGDAGGCDCARTGVAVIEARKIIATRSEFIFMRVLLHQLPPLGERSALHGAARDHAPNPSLRTSLSPSGARAPSFSGPDDIGVRRASSR